MGAIGKPRPDLAARNKTAAMRAVSSLSPSDETRKKMSAARTVHGHARSRGAERQGTKTYYIWAAMIQRTTNPKNVDYQKYYGARGITVCDRWRDFSCFLEDMGEKPDGLTLDRIDNDGNYEPSNCRWATPLAQSKNKRQWGTA